MKAASLLLSLLLSGIACSEKPNIIFILVDDMGWSDLGCYGSEINTPHIDSLAKSGVRFTRFYNTAKCNTSRACLLTGTYPQQCGMMNPGKMTDALTIGEVLRPAGYRTLASGKHHGTENLFDRGFDHYYGLRDGCCNFWNPGRKRDGEPEPARKSRTRAWCDDAQSYHPFTPEDKGFYTTDAFTNKALEWLDEEDTKEKPFFLYLAYTAPHYPLHAWPEDIAKYHGVYDQGYLAIRNARYQRMIEMGLIDPAKNPLPAWDGKDWEQLDGSERDKEKRRMEIYAAMLDRVDQNIGRLIRKLREQGRFDNTLILFASDNGGCAEAAGGTLNSTEIKDFGSISSYETVGPSWATVQNTPLRKWKNWSHEGGIRTPLIAHWPGKIQNTGRLIDQPGHLIDIMPTLIDLTGANYPPAIEAKPVIPLQGVSLLPALAGKPIERKSPIFWQWSGGGAIRINGMKAVFWGNKKNQAWELYDFSSNHNETRNLADQSPDQLQLMRQQWESWMQSMPAAKNPKH